LRVSAPLAFGSRYLATAIPLYLKRFPQVEIEMELHDREVNLVDEGFDLALRVTSSPDPSLISLKIAESAHHICATPKYLSERGVPRTPTDLPAHNCLFYSRPPANTWRLTKGDRTHNVVVSGNFFSNSGQALLTAALEDQGLVYLSALHVHDAIEDGRLTPVLTDYTIPTNNIYALYMSRKFQPRKVRTFIDFLKTHFRGGTQWRNAPG
jgi:DNA-binding transcriptional LysR family regulator